MENFKEVRPLQDPGTLQLLVVAEETLSVQETIASHEAIDRVPSTALQAAVIPEPVTHQEISTAPGGAAVDVASSRVTPARQETIASSEATATQATPCWFKQLRQFFYVPMRVSQLGQSGSGILHSIFARFK